MRSHTFLITAPFLTLAMTVKHLRLPSLLMLTAAWWPSQMQGQIIPVNNGGFDVSGPAIHSSRQVPECWSLVDGKSDRVRVWNAPGSTAVALGDQASLSQTVSLASLADELRSKSQWKPAVLVDAIGAFGNSKDPTELEISLSTPEGTLLASGRFVINGKAPQSKVVRSRIDASSFQPGSEPDNAFDGDPATIWHSKWGDETHPHWLYVDFGEIKKLRGFTYLPRMDVGNGTISQFRLEVTKDGEKWSVARQGEFNCMPQQLLQTIRFPQSISCRAIRLVALAKRHGAGDINCSCAELTLDVQGGFKLDEDLPRESSAHAQRLVLSIPEGDNKRQFKKSIDVNALDQIRVDLRVHGKNSVVLDHLHMIWVPERATMEMQGKANGVSGPDALNAASYGFTGLMIHNYPALPIIEVMENSPAAKAGLKKGDLILRVNDRTLPPGNVEPGFAWLDSGHDVILGQAALNSNADGTVDRGSVSMAVLRGNKLLDLKLGLKLPEIIGDKDLLTNPDKLRILNAELIHHVVEHQQDNGSWENHPIKTAFGGLALLSTGDKKYASSIKSAANWLMERNAEPDTGFYWFPSISGIFLAEYYLATGDERVLPVMERMLKHMNMAYHTSAWGTQTFGHGPRGLPYENKSLVAVMVHTFVFENLAHRCGIDSNIQRVLQDYIESAWSDPAQGGHGALGYNASYKDLEEFWSRSGLLTLTHSLAKARPDMRSAMTKVMRNRHPWFRNSHAYGEPGGAFGLIGLASENESWFNEVFSQYRWWFAVALDPGYGLRYTPPHMGAPYMEGDVLINNCYALVTNLYKNNLHISGSNEKNWLDVSKIEVPLTEVLILQNQEGLVTLRCRIPGPSIHYTVDGSEPTSVATKYQSPFTIPAGATVKAVAVDKKAVSKISTRTFALPKRSWKIVSATGQSDPDLAIARASHAIDGDLLIGWVTDGGEKAAGYPHELILDLGEKQTVSSASIQFLFPESGAKRITVFQPSDGDHANSLVDSQRLGEYNGEPEAMIKIDLLQPVQIRQIGFRFEEPSGEGILMVGEIDLAK